MATLVYLLCAATSAACAILLVIGYRRSRAQLLFWAALCFTGIALNNVILLIDLSVVPETDLSVWRSIPTLVGLMLLIHGLIRES